MFSTLASNNAAPMAGPAQAHAFFADLGVLPVIGVAAPFVLLLLCIAVLPLASPHFWEKNRNKSVVAFVFAVPIAILVLSKESNTFASTLLDYGAFIALLSALFTISGGIYVRGSFKGNPLVNTAFLLVGAVLANFIGTTGASVLLVRPLLRANKHRNRKAHVFVFFIFIVSNCGGLLTPLGDPPLFLGFLNGVPFSWTLRLWREWAFIVGTLLVIAYLVDRWFYARDHAAPGEKAETAAADTATATERIGLEGLLNVALLILVIGVILVSGYAIYPIEGHRIFDETLGAQLAKIVQIAGLGSIAFASYRLANREVHRQNTFHFGPLVEVAVLFAGIFVTMIPVLLILETKGASLGVNQPWHFFWATGGLSSVLDNAPTYLTFSSLAKGILGLSSAEGLKAVVHDPTGAKYLAAISAGAVFMGANTYIGNGPNFMVKAIVEASGVKMPTFFGYILVSIVVLLPLFALTTVIFFI
ncbi:MAG: sodium:proton antiporter [Chloroflexi bacterium]|nr:sodium:proton antiporter [Chloroflexota bacterium]